MTSAFDDALFDGVFLGGFECSCHRLEDGRRLDMQASTRHDELARADYRAVRDVGMTACRDGVSWVKVERRTGMYDFGSAAELLHAAEGCGVRVIWDLMHFGWPDDVDLFSPSFPERFGKYARAFATWYASEMDGPPMVSPINEMSFLAWAGGDVRCLNPFEAARGVELKVQLVRATIEAIEAIRSVVAGARFFQPEPVIHIVPSPDHPKTWRRVESDELLQYQAWDMLTGRVWPGLGGRPGYLDIIGVNFYPDNQFMLDGTTIGRQDTRYKPFSAMLLEVWNRYGRPMIVSETGAEGDARAPWLRYVCAECVSAMRMGCELHGVTLYPVIDHPGWVDGRHCRNGLWEYADEQGRRRACVPLLREIERQRGPLLAARTEMLRHKSAGTRHDQQHDSGAPTSQHEPHAESPDHSRR
jgi:beta-glucosidase/6-phospho-beta-glucosidase/beta-galactosidase